MPKVIKKNRKKQAFKASKIRKGILNAAKDARVSSAKRQRIARKITAHIIQGVKGKKTVKIANIRRAVLSHLAVESRPAVHAWQLYERRK